MRSGRSERRDFIGSVPSGGADAAQGDVRARFASHVELCAPAMRSIAAGVLGRPGQIDDVVQEATLIALRKFDCFTEGTSFAAWMGQIVRFTALNTARRSLRGERGRRGSEPLAEIESPFPTVAVGMDRHGRLEEPQQAFDDDVVSALNELDETPRICLLLRLLNDLPYTDIARIVGIPEGTAMSHVHRARRVLRDKLAPSSRPVEATS